jgi:hypothetical protein
MSSGGAGNCGDILHITHTTRGFAFKKEITDLKRTLNFLMLKISMWFPLQNPTIIKVTKSVPIRCLTIENYI